MIIISLKRLRYPVTHAVFFQLLLTGIKSLPTDFTDVEKLFHMLIANSLLYITPKPPCNILTINLNGFIWEYLRLLLDT